jgi:hypothetical protein
MENRKAIGDCIIETNHYPLFFTAHRDTVKRGCFRLAPGFHPVIFIAAFSDSLLRTTIEQTARTVHPVIFSSVPNIPLDWFHTCFDRRLVSSDKSSSFIYIIIL